MLRVEANRIYPGNFYKNILILLLGHGPVVEDPKQKISSYIQHRLQREREILEFIGKERLASAMQITNSLYKVSNPLKNIFKY